MAAQTSENIVMEGYSNYLMPIPMLKMEMSERMSIAGDKDLGGMKFEIRDNVEKSKSHD